MKLKNININQTCNATWNKELFNSCFWFEQTKQSQSKYKKQNYVIHFIQSIKFKIINLFSIQFKFNIQFFSFTFLFVRYRSFLLPWGVWKHPVPTPPNLPFCFFMHFKGDVFEKNSYDCWAKRRRRYRLRAEFKNNRPTRDTREI